jgi:hypothetical protein
MIKNFGYSVSYSLQIPDRVRGLNIFLRGGLITADESTGGRDYLCESIADRLDEVIAEDAPYLISQGLLKR